MQFVNAFFYLARRVAIAAQAGDQLLAAERHLLQSLQNLRCNAFKGDNAPAGNQVQKILPSALELMKLA
jgi:hypothetical protein